MSDIISVENQGALFLTPDPGGLVNTLSIPVPANDGDGAPVDVSAYVGQKTFDLSGNYEGRYVILGSHNGVLYAPLLSFQAGQFGQQEVKKTIPFVVKFVKVRRRASATVTINMAAQLSCSC